MDKKGSVVIVAPVSTGDEDIYMLDFFQLVLKDASVASLPNLDRLFNARPPSLEHVDLRAGNSMAGYYLESWLKLRGYDAHTVFEWEGGEAFSRLARSVDPIAVALSTTFLMDQKSVAIWLERVQSTFGNVPIIVGGAYVRKNKIRLDQIRDMDWLQAMREFGVEPTLDCMFVTCTEAALRKAIYITSEFGEHTLLKILERIEQGRCDCQDLVGIPNLALPMPNGTWQTTAEELEPVNLDTDYTRWDLVESVVGLVPIRASLGCPYKCRFCDYRALHSTMRLRSPESILEEIQLAKSRGGFWFYFIDDNAFLTTSRISQLTTAIIQNSLDIEWGGFLRADRINETNIQNIYASGCRLGVCGIESGDLGQLKRMGKQCRLESVARGIDLATEAGIRLSLSFVLGFPGETRETLDNTIAFINRIASTNKNFATYRIAPLTVNPISLLDGVECRRQYNLRGGQFNWSHDTMTRDEVIQTWQYYLFRHAEAVTYEYYGQDFPEGWSIQKRNEAFQLRKQLAVDFIDQESDSVVQSHFAQLWRLIRDPGESLEIPSWQAYMAERMFQPGTRNLLLQVDYSELEDI